MVRSKLPRADTSPGTGLACNRQGRQHADPGSDGIRQDAVGVSVGHRPAGVGPDARGRPPHSHHLSVAPASASRRRRQEPARPDQGHLAGSRAARHPDASTDRWRAYRRHDAKGTPPDRQASTRHSDHHSRVAVSDVDVTSARGPDPSGSGDHRRDPRARWHQTRRPHVADAGAARSDQRGNTAAHWPVGDAATARRNGPLSGRT